MLLYEKIRDAIHIIKLIVYYFRTQKHDLAYHWVEKLSEILEECLVNLPQELAEEYLPVLKMSIEAADSQDAVWLSDIYTDGLLPLLYRTQEIVFEASDTLLTDYWKVNRRALKLRFPELYHKILEVRENIPDQYKVHWAKTGDLVMDVDLGEGESAMMSSIDPWEEALYYSESMNAEEYLAVGFALGYHIELLSFQAQYKKLTILENDLNQLAIALSYRDLTYLLNNEKVFLAYCPKPEDYTKYFADVTEKTQVCFWLPSVKKIQNAMLREALEDYAIKLSSVRSMNDELQRNFKENVLAEDKEVSAIKEIFYKKEVLFIAAGPSLDENIEILQKGNRSEMILLCAGKAALRLVNEGIVPDYIIVTDALARTRWQLEGIEDCGASLIYLSTTAQDVVKSYKGEKYIAFQKGYPEAENYACEHGYALFETGGSVATFALDLLLSFQCKRIICLGLDLGFPGEKTHTGDIGKSVNEIKNLRRVEGICTEYVYTSKPLDIYRKWIERRITNVKQTELLNASKGARIHGMKEIELKDYL